MKNRHILAALSGLCIACSQAPPAPQVPGRIQAADGRWLETRVVRHLSRRPKEVFHVYRDSTGAFIRHGSDTRYYMTGQVKFQEHYRDGLLDSVTEFWYPNGNKQGELPYKDGKPHGKAITWYPDGKKMSEKNWEDGRLQGLSIEWDEKGKKRRETLWNRNSPENPVQKR